MGRSERAAFCIASALVLAACGFPSHQFIPDNQFDDASVTTGGTSGTGGGVTGGSGGTSGSGGATGGSGGVAGTGGACGNNSECLPAPSNGFQGPVAVWTGKTSDTAPSCSTSGGYPNQKLNLKTNVSTPAATCPTCTCDAPTGVTCPTSVDLTYYGGANCGGSTYWGDPSNPIAVTSQCGNWTLAHGPNGEHPQSAVFDALPTGGTCMPHSSGQANIPPPTYDQVRVCGDATTSACGSGSVCAPTPAQSFKLCVYQSGDVTCPQPFSQKSTDYTSLSDGRMCSNCDCGVPTGDTCSGTVTDSTGATCGSNPTTSIQAGSCTPVPADSTTGTLEGGIADTRNVAYTPGTASGGSCPVIASQVTGILTKIGQYTICCIP